MRLRRLILSSLLLACALAAQAQQLGALPATFKGDLPCVDCSAVQYQLDLFADNTYDLAMVYRGKAVGAVRQTGAWEVTAPRRMTLRASGKPAMQFYIESPNSLQLSNEDGTPIVSSRNYSLVRDVATPAALTITNWRLTRLQGEAARRFANQIEPHVVLHDDGRVTGSDGCNRLTGSYQRAGGKLAFGQIAATRMACINGAQQAAMFAAALSGVASYRIAGRHLELIDAADTLLMRFEAVSVK